MELRPLRISRSSVSKRRRSSLVSCVENPFENNVPWTYYEVFKAFVLGPTIFPLRLVVLLIAFLSGVFFAWLATIGFPPKEDRGCLYYMKPMSRWRRCLMLPIILTNRLVLWSLGFWHIRIRDHRPKGCVQPLILVASPHTAAVDALVMAWVFPIWPSPVAAKELLKTPLVGTICKASHGIFVDRKQSESREACKDAIAARSDPRWTGPPLLIFPEGTCTNAKVLIQFRVGAFSPGQSVLPVCLRFPNSHFDISWVGNNRKTCLLLLRMMLQFINFCTVDICGPYEPMPEEISDPKLFADNVRAQMADMLGVAVTAHSYDDVFLSYEAAKMGVGSNFLVKDLQSKYKFGFEELKFLLRKFKELDRHKTGFISYDDFVAALGDASRSDESLQRLFSFFDTDETGRIVYREFVQYAALLTGECSAASRAKLAFLMYDTEGSGRVRVATLCTALDECVLYVPEDLESIDGCSAVELGTKLENTKLKMDQLVPVVQPDLIGKVQLAHVKSPGESLLERLGKQGHDEITLDEFVDLIDKNPQVLDAGLQLARDRLGMPNLGRPMETE